jgi:phosphoadenosine phosphosulfate reductase
MKSASQTTATVDPQQLTMDLKAANRYLRSLSATERIAWAGRTFNSSLYALTSAGVDSALLLDHIAKSQQSVPVIHINTGFLPKETVAFRDSLQQRYGFQLYEFGPDKKHIKDITAQKLWEADLSAYSKVTKLEPMSRAINKLGVRALLTGVRGDQTPNRATLGYIGQGNDGELRINPFIDWSQAQVAAYISSNNLPRNPLYDQGFESVGDWHTTRPGKNRNGRTVMECGLHMVNGRLVRQNSQPQ